MADETTFNGVQSVVDPTKHPILKKDRGLEMHDEVLDLERRIVALEEEKYALLSENLKQSERIKLMKLDIDRFKENQAWMEERLEEKQIEMDPLEDDKKELKGIAAPEAELETEVFRLQRDLQSSMLECEEATTELKQLTDAYEELKQSNREKDSKINDLEKEKDIVMEEMDKSKAKMAIQIRYLEEEAKALVSDMENLEKAKKEMETLQYSLEEKLKQSEGKLKETEKVVRELEQKNSEMEEMLIAYAAERAKMEKKILELEKVEKELEQKNSEMEEKLIAYVEERAEMEKRILELEKEEEIEEIAGEGKGYRFPWPVAAAAASTGTVLGAVAMIYLRNARQR